MTNEQLRTLKRFIKFKNVIDVVAVKIDNLPEKLSGKKVRGKIREFTDQELGYIESALISLAHTIIKNSNNEHI